MEDNSVKTRLENLEHLGPDDWRQLLAGLKIEHISQAELRAAIYQIRITYDLVNAIHKLDAVSTKLSKRLIVLTWAIVILTALLTVEPAVHFIEWLSHHQ